MNFFSVPRRGGRRPIVDSETADGVEFDVVVIGGGHNGLVAANYLSRADLRVIVLEANDYLGGMAASQPFISEAPAHVVSPGAIESVLLPVSPVIDDLDLASHGYREIPSPGYVWLGDSGESLYFQKDVAATVADIARFSRSDAERYAEVVGIGDRLTDMQRKLFVSHPHKPSAGALLTAVRHLVQDRRLRTLLPSLGTKNAVEAITGMFDSAPLQGALMSMTQILTSPTLPGSGIAVLGTVPLHQGCARPVGGMGGFVAALERCLIDSGGTIRTGVRVAAVHEVNDRASTVELDDGTVVRARRAVVAAIPVQRVADLVGDGLPKSAAAKLRDAPGNAFGVGSMTVNLALHHKIAYPLHQSTRTDVDLRQVVTLTGSADSVVEAHLESARGELPTRFPWWGACLAAVDPTQAPDGQDTFYMFSPVPVNPTGGWPASRNLAAQQLIDQVANFAPAALHGEIGRYIETPDDLRARTGAENGCYYHVDMVPPTRQGPFRPAWGLSGYRTPLRGLYLTGAGTHPGGGVSGLPGMQTAKAVLAQR